MTRAKCLLQKETTMSYSTANLIGFIEIDAASSSSAFDDDSSGLRSILHRCWADSRVPQSPRWKAECLTIDADQLKQELELEFQRMLQRLFQGE